MKRMLLFCLAAVLCLSSACAETRQRYIELEGDQEEITETLYESALGFSFWYDADRLTVDEGMSESGQSLILSPQDSDLPIYLEIMLAGALDTESFNYLDENAEADTEYEFDVTEAGGDITYFQKPFEYNPDLVTVFYTLEEGNDFAAAYACFPEEAAEGYGEVFLRLLSTLTFRPLPALALEWGPENEEDEDWEEGEALVIFTARKPLSDFQLLALDLPDMEDADAPEYLIETVYRHPGLAAGESLTLPLIFYGDMSNNGVSFVDAEGNVCRYAIDVSGRDGSLLLWAF